MPTWNFNSQNYKINKKIKEEVDPNQINYRESDDDPLDVIKRMYIYITDEEGNTLPEVTITIDEMEIITGYNGILISNFPNEEQTITVEKTGYKSTTSTVIYNAENQTHEFVLVPSNSNKTSSSTATGSPRFIAKTYYFRSYDDENKTTLWGEGTARTTGIVEGNYSEVKILTNSTEESFIGQKFFIESDAEADQIYELFTDAGTTSANIYVEISETPFEYIITLNMIGFKEGDEPKISFFAPDSISQIDENYSNIAITNNPQEITIPAKYKNFRIECEGYMPRDYTTREGDIEFNIELNEEPPIINPDPEMA